MRVGKTEANGQSTSSVWVSEWVSIHAGEQVGKSWCAWHLREEVRIMRSIEKRENKGGYKKGSKWSTKVLKECMLRKTARFSVCSCCNFFCHPSPWARETLTLTNINPPPLISLCLYLWVWPIHAYFYLEGGKERGLEKGCQFYWHFHFQCNLIPITSTWSGANFCFSLTPASEERVGGGKREKGRKEGWNWKGAEAVSGSHVGEMSTVLPEPVGERERQKQGETVRER